MKPLKGRDSSHQEIETAIDFGTSVFVCGKPSHVLNCLSICRAYKIPNPDIVFYNSVNSEFKELKNFLESSSYSELSATIHLCGSTLDAANIVKSLQRNSLFVWDDRTSFYNLFAPLKKRTLVLYEEGLGTYRGTYSFSMDLLRKTKWRIASLITGCGFDFGYGRKTDYVFVRFPDIFKQLHPRISHKVRSLPGLVSELECALREWEPIVLRAIIPPVEVKGRVGLILGTHEGIPGFDLDSVSRFYDILLFKPHPDDSATTIDGTNLISNSWIPAEICLDFLARSADQVDVFHYSSSTSIYLRNSFPNVTFINLRPSLQIQEFEGFVV